MAGVGKKSCQSMTQWKGSRFCCIGLIINSRAIVCSNFGKMFFRINEYIDDLSKISSHGSKINLAERSLGCQAVKADANLFRIVG